MSTFLERIDRAIDESAIDSASVGKALREAHDVWMIAEAAKGALFRDLREGVSIHGSEGAIVLHRVTNKPITPEQVRRVEMNADETRDAYTSALNAASQALAKLHDLKKRRENWLNAGEYEAEQARREAALTPAERAARERREQYQRDANATTAAR